MPQRNPKSFSVADDMQTSNRTLSIPQLSSSKEKKTYKKNNLPRIQSDYKIDFHSIYPLYLKFFQTKKA